MYYGKIKQIHGRMLKEGLFPAKIENALDIGSGEGCTLLYLKENHEKSGKNTPLNLHAIEPSSRCLKTLKEFGINVISNDVDSDWHKKYKHKFDFIIMRHVLEHFMDPVSVLKKVSSSLTKDGLVYIAVPNSMNPQLPLNKTFFRAVHTFYFSRISLHNVINLSNLEIMHLSASPKDSPHEIYALCRKSRKAVPPVILNDEFFLQKEVLSNSYKKEKSFKFKIDNSINNLKNHTKRRIIKLIPSGIKRAVI